MGRVVRITRASTDRIVFVTYRSSRDRDIQMLAGVIVGIAGVVVLAVAIAASQIRRDATQCESTAAAHSRHAEMLDALANGETRRHWSRRRHGGPGSKLSPVG